jgi:hypothetical protein
MVNGNSRWKSIPQWPLRRVPALLEPQNRALGKYRLTSLGLHQANSAVAANGGFAGFSISESGSTPFILQNVGYRLRHLIRISTGLGEVEQ